jgi:hypothetical protein
MEQSHSWQANSHSSRQEIPSSYANRKFIIILQELATEAYPKTNASSSNHPKILP